MMLGVEFDLVNKSKVFLIKRGEEPLGTSSHLILKINGSKVNMHHSRPLRSSLFLKLDRLGWFCSSENIWAYVRKKHSVSQSALLSAA